MRPLGLIGFSILFAGCPPDETERDARSRTATDPETTDDDGTSDTGEAEIPCKAEILTVEPPDGEYSVALDAKVVVFLSRPVGEGDWSLTVTPAEGTPVEGDATLAVDGTFLEFVADDEWIPDTQYTVQAEVCEVPTTTLFTTRNVEVDEASLEGQTYAVPWGSLTFTEPSNGGSILRDAIDVDDVLIQFPAVDEDAEEVDTAVALSIDDSTGSPDPMCDTLVSETSDFSGNPVIAFGPKTVTVPLTGAAVPSIDVEELTLSAEVATDFSKLLYAEISGLVATDDLLGDSCEESVLVALTKGKCEDCSTSASGKCLLLAAEVGEAPEIDLDLLGECLP